MRKVRMVLILAALLATPTVFAEDDMSSDDSSCHSIVSACKKAGFGKKENDKRFWADCMKPLVLGKTVDGVTVNPADVTACRTAKIEKMKKELEQMQAVGSKN